MEKLADQSKSQTYIRVTMEKLADQSKSQTYIRVTMEKSAVVTINLKNLLFEHRAFIYAT